VYSDGNRAFQEGDFERAGQLFEQSFTLQPIGTILFDARQAYRRAFEKKGSSVLNRFDFRALPPIPSGTPPTR
jgi:hypothetical protein